MTLKEAMQQALELGKLVNKAHEEAEAAGEVAQKAKRDLEQADYRYKELKEKYALALIAVTGYTVPQTEDALRWFLQTREAS